MDHSWIAELPVFYERGRTSDSLMLFPLAEKASEGTSPFTYSSRAFGIGAPHTNNSVKPETASSKIYLRSLHSSSALACLINGLSSSCQVDALTTMIGVGRSIGSESVLEINESARFCRRMPISFILSSATSNFLTMRLMNRPRAVSWAQRWSFWACSIHSWTTGLSWKPLLWLKSTT